MRRLAAILALTLVAACSGAPAGPGGSGSPAGSGAGPVGSLPTADSEVLQGLLDSGMAPSDAALLAATTFESFPMEARKTRIVEHLATGDTVGFIVTVGPETTGEPGLVSMTTTGDDTGFRVHMEYLVSNDGLTEDARKALDGSAARGAPMAGLGNAPGAAAPPLTAGTPVTQVLVDWGLNKGVEMMRDQMIEAVVQRFVPTEVGVITKIIKAGFTIDKGISLGDDLDALLRELDALEACAQNPTNPLTQDMYRDDPGAKQRILDEIAAARRDMIANTIVQQIGELNKFAAKFGPKWLSWAIGPGTAWSKQALKDVNKERLEQLKRGIPKCDGDCAWASTPGAPGGGGGSSGGQSTPQPGPTGQTCRFPFTLTGRVDVTWTQDNEVVFTAAITNVKWQYDPAQSAASHSVYNLVGGTINWRYDDSDPEAGCGTIEWHGGGTETVVPDEPRDTTPLEAGGGMPDEAAFLTITWADADPSRQVPYYHAQGVARLHDKIENHYSCGGEVRQLDPNFMGQLTTWVFLPFDPPRVAVNQRLAGTWVNDAVPGAVYTYTWDFSEGP